MTKHIQIEAYEIHTEAQEHGITLFKQSDAESFSFRLTRYTNVPALNQPPIPGGVCVGFVAAKFGFPTLEAARTDAEEYINNPLKFIGH